MEKHEQIPLLKKLEISYICDKCKRRMVIPSLYKGADEVVEAASVKSGLLICESCRKICAKNLGVVEKL